MGVNFETEKDNITKYAAYQLPEILVRYGLFSFAELRVQGQLKQVRFNFVNYPYPDDITTTGFSDLHVGTKIQIFRNQGLRPDLALQADFKLPAGYYRFTGNKIEPKIRLNFNNKLTEKLALQYNLGLEWEENHPYWDTQKYDRIGLYTLALNYKFTDKLAGFLEAFGELDDHTLNQSFDFGLAYLLRPNLQLDAYSGFGLSEYAPDFFISAGISFRLPKN